MGIPFPVFARAAYGTLGSNVPALMLTLVTCGWFGIQAWIGGEAVHAPQDCDAVLADAARADFGGHTTTEWLSFLLFWGLNVWIIYRGMDLLRAVENWAAPFVLVMTALLRSGGPCACQRNRPAAGSAGQVPHLGEFLPIFFPSLTAMIGYWATLSLADLPDSRAQPARADVGQVVALPTTMSVFAAMGVLITSATVIIYGEAIWDPVQLVAALLVASHRRHLDVHGRGRHAGRQHRR